MLRHCWIALLVVIIGSVCWAQDRSVRRFEAGFQFTALDLTTALGEKPAGIGGRFGYNWRKHLAAEAEVNYFPQNPSGNYGETQALFGVKAGQRFGPFGIFGKARGGFVHFGGRFYRSYNGDNPTCGAVDLGGVLEFYPRERVGIRLDMGDTIVAYPDRPIYSGSIQPTAVGAKHEFQGSIGLFFRF